MGAVADLVIEMLADSEAALLAENSALRNELQIWREIGAIAYAFGVEGARQRERKTRDCWQLRQEYSDFRERVMLEGIEP